MLKFLNKWNKRRNTVNELSRMSDRELSDIGISRLNIKEVARDLI